MKKDSIYTYPAIFSESEKGMYGVVFPDIPGCITCGDNLPDDLSMACDSLALMIYTVCEEKGVAVPKSSSAEIIKYGEGEFVADVVCDRQIV